MTQASFSLGGVEHRIRARFAPACFIATLELLVE
jgi:hypothetical protein